MLTMDLKKSIMLSTGTFQKELVSEINTDFKILSKLPFLNIKGASYDWNVETVLGEVEFRAVGEGVNPTHVGLERKQATLSILADEIEVDNFTEKTSGFNHLEHGMQNKVNGMYKKFENQLLHGDKTIVENGFDGLSKLVSKTQTVEATADIVGDIDHLIDKLVGDPTVLIMSKSTRRQVVSQARGLITYSTNSFDEKLTHYGDDIEILDVDDDVLPFGTIYAAKFDQNDGLCGITNGGLICSDLGELGNKPAVKARIEWYCGLVLHSPKALSVRVMG